MDNPALIVPEFLGFFVGIVVTLVTWLIYFAMAEGKAHRDRLDILQANLFKAGRAWSSVEGRWVEFSEFDPKLEYKKHLRTKLILIFLLPLLSWFGFVFSLILMLSFKFVPTRMERQIFESHLVSNSDLSREEVELFLKQISV